MKPLNASFTLSHNELRALLRNVLEKQVSLVYDSDGNDSIRLVGRLAIESDRPALFDINAALEIKGAGGHIVTLDLDQEDISLLIDQGLTEQGYQLVRNLEFLASQLRDDFFTEVSCKVKYDVRLQVD
jgi:hypothetical protein